MELVDDIERYMNHEAVLAAAPSVPYKVRKFIRRHYVSVVAGSVVTAALIIGGMLAIIGFNQANTIQNGVRLLFAPVDGEYVSNLSNGGDNLTLSDFEGNVIDRFTIVREKDDSYAESHLRCAREAPR